MDDHRNATRFKKQKSKKYVGQDPVLQESIIEKRKEEEKVISKDEKITPSLSTRIDLKISEPYPVGVKYIPPHPKNFEKISEKKKRELEKDRKFCKYPITKIPSVVPSTKLNINLKAPSAEIKEAKVFPRKASITPSQIYPEPPKKKQLKEHEPKSGVVINIRKKRRVVKKKKVVPPPVREPTIEELIAQELATIQEFGEGEDYSPPVPENYLTKQFRKKVAQLSKTTSYNTKDFTVLETTVEEEEGEDIIEEEDRFISKLSQKFRRDSEIGRYEPPKKKPKKGTLENFSFTKLKQPTRKTFYYGIKMATIHQGDSHFPSSSRNKQGICMPIAAYCFSILKHPDKWTQGDIDDILEAGNDLFLESAGFHHMHGDDIALKVLDLQKYCVIGNKKINFTVSEPEVSGMVRSEDRKVYNVTKAINIFFGRFKAGILQTEDFCVALWKDKHYYFFDAAPRTLDLYSNPDGTALLAHFYDTTSIISVLLDRSNLKNTSFVIYSIDGLKVVDARKSDQEEEETVIKESDNFQVLSAEKAVAQGSFDLADKCFGFSRNKQALTIAVIALVYSKITPCNSWHRGTIDKIVIIGNQLFLECIENDETEEVQLDDLPAVFTIGPYVVEIYISSNRFIDFMYKKGKCVLLVKLEKFFETNSNAIVQIDKDTIAVWKQRDVYHCFDPYSRNNEGFRSKNGTACVSMHTTLKSMVDTIATNFDGKDLIFRVHALKMCKIHRDPNKNYLFPRNLTMNDHPIECFKKHKMKRGKRKATAKKVTVDPTTRATIGDVGDASIMEVGSTVRSIGMEDIPPMVHKHHSKIMLVLTKPLDKDMVVDLDSPSLSDTQIEPEPPEQPEGDVIDFKDVDSYELTQEELELSARGEHEGQEGGGGSGGGEGSDMKSKVKEVEKEMETMQGGEDDWYMAAADFTQVGSHSLISRLSEEMNTEFPIFDIPEEEVPVMVRNIAVIARRKIESEDKKYECEMTFDEEVNMWEEYMKESNFVNLPDNSQIILGTKNMAQYGDDLEIMAPFICIMAVTVASKYAIDSWSKDIVDYVLKCGASLHQNSNTRYDQNYKLEIAKISLGSTDFSVKVDYIFDTYIKSRILAMAISKMLFPRCPAGILVTPTYSCAIFCKKHLYYLYDGFGNNEVGLGKGTSNEGVACLARFTNVEHLVKRILHNKTKREKEENIEYDRFVLSSCYVKLLEKREKPEEDDEEELMGGQEDDGIVEEPIEVKEYKKPPKDEPEPPKKPPKKGYHPINGLHKIEGTKSLNSAGAASEMLKEDYFVCVCACLLILNNPFKTWDEKKVDAALDEGVHIFNYAEDIDVCTKKFIKNILLDDYVFDIIINRVVFTTFKTRRTLKTGIETLLQRKKKDFIIQFPNRCYTLHVDVDNNTYHLFDPNDKDKASWTRYKNFAKLVNRIKSGISRGSENYNFHSLEIMSITNAPKHVIVGNRSKRYKMLKEKKAETYGKPFHEQCSWLNVDIIPWSWKTDKTTLPKWNNWFVDFPNDLFSLFGTLSPLDEVFPAETTGKRTLGNLVVAIGMTQIYELCDWSEAIMDSILLNGSIFFEECIKDIAEENYEIAFEDIKKECKIFPYSFRVKFTPVVEGTMFLIRLKQFNLYKSLRLFFDDYERRYGVIYVSKGDNDRRLFAFGKLQESEYFMYDCDTLGPPMYVQKDVGVPYILRATTLNRLLHVMTLTLKGGDFYVFDVGLSEMKTIE